MGADEEMDKEVLEEMDEEMDKENKADTNSRNKEIKAQKQCLKSNLFRETSDLKVFVYTYN